MKKPEKYLRRGKGNFINCVDYDDAIKAMNKYAEDYHNSKIHEEVTPKCPKCKARETIINKVSGYCQCGICGYEF